MRDLVLLDQARKERHRFLARFASKGESGPLGEKEKIPL